jgi:hypothetical protein
VQFNKSQALYVEKLIGGRIADLFGNAFAVKLHSMVGVSMRWLETGNVQSLGTLTADLCIE